MRPIIRTYSSVIAVPDTGPETSAADFGIGTCSDCCAWAVVNASVPTSTAAMKVSLCVVLTVGFLSFVFMDPSVKFRRSLHEFDLAWPPLLGEKRFQRTGSR